MTPGSDDGGYEMTCIVAVSDGARVTIGGDSAGILRELSCCMTMGEGAKVFVRGPYAIGFTTSFRMGQLLRFRAELPPPAGEDLDRFMSTDFIDAVRQAFRTGGWIEDEKGRESGGGFLVGVGGRIYQVWPDFSVTTFGHPYAAVGSGLPVAIGALHALASRGLTSREIARGALDAAATFALEVRRPFHFVESPPFAGSVHAARHRCAVPAVR